MRKKIYFALLACLVWSVNAGAQTKVFVYILNHNEDNIGYLNGTGGYNLYENNRTALVNFANLVQAKNAKWNYGSDHVALRAIAQYDTGVSIINTNNKNLIRWLKE